MARARGAIELILKQQVRPYPAIVFSRQWDLLMANSGRRADLFGWLLGGPSAERNVMRMAFDPRGLRPFIANWDEVARDLLRQLRSGRRRGGAPGMSGRTGPLRCGMCSPTPTVPGRWNRRMRPPIRCGAFRYRKDGRELNFFWTITTFGTAQDVTLQEIRIECSFPADEATAVWCRELALDPSR